MPKEKTMGGRRRPIRTGIVRLEGDYLGTEATVRLNPPFETFDRFRTDTRAALGEVILEWNLVDDDGKPVVLEPTLSKATDEELALFAAGYLDLLQASTDLPKGPATPSGTGTPTST